MRAISSLSSLLFTHSSPPPLFPVAWHGSLLEGKQDKTGTLYRRNRSYDPLAGRFTQEDPIGLAGGVNLYGFAAGDPVNFADPFGLAAGPCGKAALVCALVSFAGDFLDRGGLSADVPKGPLTTVVGGTEDAGRNLRGRFRIGGGSPPVGRRGVQAATKEAIPGLLSRATGNALGSTVRPILGVAVRGIGFAGLGLTVFDNLFDIDEQQSSAICAVERCARAVTPEPVTVGPRTP